MPQYFAIMLKYVQVWWENYYAQNYASIMWQGLELRQSTSSTLHRGGNLLALWGLHAVYINEVHQVVPHAVELLLICTGKVCRNLLRSIYCHQQHQANVQSWRSHPCCIEYEPCRLFHGDMQGRACKHLFNHDYDDDNEHWI